MVAPNYAKPVPSSPRRWASVSSAGSAVRRAAELGEDRQGAAFGAALHSPARRESVAVKRCRSRHGRCWDAVAARRGGKGSLARSRSGRGPADRARCERIPRAELQATAACASRRMRSIMDRAPFERCAERCSPMPISRKTVRASISAISSAVLPRRSPLWALDASL